MSVPYWAQDAVFYQIFPDRFANGDTGNDPPNAQPWGAPPTIHGFQGGDLRGIIQRFDTLLDLGVTALYLNPIFLASSNHRYNTTDYYQIDPRLGTLRDFRALLEVAHRNEVRVLLDGVFNHCGRGFFAFSDLLENQDRSGYRDWFHVARFPIDAYSPGLAQDYKAWWDYKSLPKFNTGNPAVRRYLLGVARYWIEQGADGWRLDVPNEIDDDSFWADFRAVVRDANPDAFLIGEIWDGQPRWVGEQHFDGLMNYPFRTAALGYAGGTLPASGLAAELDRLLALYPRENSFAMYNLLGSHDTERMLTVLGGDVRRAKLGLTLQFAFPGAPAVYYGDEIGLEGGKDPECRKAFPWDPAQWNQELRTAVQRLIELRKRLPVLRRGSLQPMLADDARGLLIFARRLGETSVVVALNNSATRRQVRLPVSALGWADGTIVRSLLGSAEFGVSGDILSFSIDPCSGLLLR